MSRMPVSTPFGLPWPLPAIGAWGCAWVTFVLLVQLRLPAWLAAAWALLAPAWVALQSAGWLRRSLVLAGFPLSSLVLGQSAAIPPWAWLFPLVALLAIYPVRAWRDAPVFPTTRGTLDGLAARLSLPAQARILDAGCGLGHGLRELQAQWPSARLDGVERSALLAMMATLRCPYARVRSADMWAGSWAKVDLLYLFQRPESMPQAWQKACLEMRPGSWMVSLEFAVPGITADFEHQAPGHRRLWIYRIPGRSSGSTALVADR